MTLSSRHCDCPYFPVAGNRSLPLLSAAGKNIAKIGTVTYFYGSPSGHLLLPPSSANAMPSLRTDASRKQGRLPISAAASPAPCC